MSREVRGIPPAPRRVRLGKVLGYRWPLAAVAFTLAIYGGVWTWMVFLAAGGKAGDQRRLDAAAELHRVPGVVTAVEQDVGRFDGERRADGVEFRYEYGGIGHTQTSYAPAGAFAVGQSAEVEMIPGVAAMSRLVGTRMDLLPAWVRPDWWLLALVVPGALCGLGYLAGTLHLYRVLVHGDAGVAEIVAVQRVRFVLPETWSVRFTFRDHGAQVRRSRHWVRAHSPLGHRLAAFDPMADRPLRVPVLHDRRFPQHCRLVVAEDCEGTAGGPPPEPTSGLDADVQRER